MGAGEDLSARKLHRLLSGTDGPGRRALPAGEFLHPVPLLFVALLAVNDHVLKGSGLLPAWATGKLSDLAGFAFFPLLCTAVLDCALLGLARLGAPVDFSLRRWKLAAAVLGTAALMALIKLSPAGADLVAGLLTAIGFASWIAVDPTDLYTLPGLLVPLWIGRRELARVPLGRLEVLERAWKRARTPVADGLRDVSRLADPAAVAALAAAFERYLETGDPAPARTALAALRD